MKIIFFGGLHNKQLFSVKNIGIANIKSCSRNYSYFVCCQYVVIYILQIFYKLILYLKCSNYIADVINNLQTFQMFLKHSLVQH